MNTREFNRDYLAEGESWVSIEENLTDKTKLSDTPTTTTTREANGLTTATVI